MISNLSLVFYYNIDILLGYDVFTITSASLLSLVELTAIIFLLEQAVAVQETGLSSDGYTLQTYVRKVTIRVALP